MNHHDIEFRRLVARERAAELAQEARPSPHRRTQASPEAAWIDTSRPALVSRLRGRVAALVPLYWS